MNFQADPVVPAKCTRRLGSVPAKTRKSLNLEPSTDSNEKRVIPAKRNRRFESTPQQPASIEKPEETISNIVAMNCKLTNEILATKKQLCEKSDALLKLQEKFHAKDIQCMNFQTEMVVMTEKIRELEKLIEQLRSERFCNDFDFDFESPGEFVSFF